MPLPNRSTQLPEDWVADIDKSMHDLYITPIAGGVENNYTLNVVDTVDRLKQPVRFDTANTAAATLNGEPIVSQTGSDLVGGELFGDVTLLRDEANSRWILQSSSGFYIDNSNEGASTRSNPFFGTVGKPGSDADWEITALTNIPSGATAAIIHATMTARNYTLWSYKGASNIITRLDCQGSTNVTDRAEFTVPLDVNGLFALNTNQTSFDAGTFSLSFLSIMLVGWHR